MLSSSIGRCTLQQQQPPNGSPPPLEPYGVTALGEVTEPDSSEIYYQRSVPLEKSPAPGCPSDQSSRLSH